MNESEGDFGMALVNMSSKDFVLSANGRELIVPRSGAWLVAASKEKVDENNGFPVWQAGNELKMIFSSGQKIEAFDGTYNWGLHNVYVVDPEVIIAVAYLQTGVTFAIPVEEKAPQVFAGLQLVNGRVA